MNKYLKANQELWNTWTPLHLESDFYDVEGFKAGTHRQRRGLDNLEVALLGDVTGKTLLHLQCHFGMDTIAWAQRGALVTGVDFSAKAIGAARSLAAEMDVQATFVQSNIYDLALNLAGQFDIVFTSHGVLGWLPDLGRWARVIAHFLAPGGTFCIVDGHPYAQIFDDRGEGPELRLVYPYFNGTEPLREERNGSYAVPETPTRGVEYVWLHKLSEVIGSLARAGLHVESFEEYPYVGWAMFPWMEQRDDGWWQFPGGKGSIPLMFSLTASKK